ncbi:hypothetical protein ACR77U_12255 [Enterococcus faecium]|uniref:hypothetical protein n=1 Tax=Enterococcus faecium TaxID=1352 RepID=UPI003DA5524F
MGWRFLDFTGLSHFFGKLPEKLVTTDTTQTISGTKSFSSTILGSVSGSAASAAKDGAGNVIADTYETKADAATHLSKSDAAGTYLSKADAASACVQTAAVDQTIAGTKTFSKPIAGSVTGSSGSCTGNAATATKLAAKRTIALSGAATGTATAFDGSGNITIPVTALASSAIRAQWYAAFPDGAEAHNAMWGGRDITAAFNNGTVSEHIADGTFKDIFPGDYITKQVTISGTAYTVNWVVADCDYWINKGDNPATTAHHVVIVPQAPIFNANMNATNTTEGGYAGSRMYRETIPACATGIVNAFGSSHILTFRDLITNTVDNNVASRGYCGWTGASAPWEVWASVQCNLMTEHMVTGAPHYSSSGIDDEITTRQMSAFRLSEKLINYNRQWWWLRNVVSSAYFAGVGGDGYAGAAGASGVVGVRPFALLR